MRKFIVSALSALSFGPSPSAGASETVVREDAFRLTLPGDWTGGYDAGSHTWSYRTSQQSEGITVGILQRANGAEPQAIKSDFEIYLRARRDQELKLGGAEFILSEPRTLEQQGAYIARFDGADRVTKRRTQTLVIVNRTVAASFYYEALALSDQEFQQRASAIFGQVGLMQ